MAKHKKQASRRSDAVKDAMSASGEMTDMGITAGGWLPDDVDGDTAAQVLIELAMGFRTPAQDDFDRQLLSADRKRSGKAGGAGQSQTLPEALWPMFADALCEIDQSKTTRRQAMAHIRKALDKALVELPDSVGATRFLSWYEGDNRKRNRKLSAMLDRTISGSGEFLSWLETLPK